MKKFICLCTLLLFGTAAISCCWSGKLHAEVNPVKADAQIMKLLSPEEQHGVRYLQDFMQTPEGIIYYLVDKKAPSSYSVSESMGQAMEYAALVGDRNLFEYYARVTDENFKIQGSYYTWKLDIASKKGETTSALVDDLRIARAYFAANDRWHAYDGELNKLSAAILSTDIDKNNYPCDFYDGEAKEPANMVSLFYLDTLTMQKLAKIDNRWNSVAGHARAILISMPENDYGFYPQSYEIDTQKYQWSDPVNMVENLYTAIDALEAGKNTALFREFLKHQIHKKRIYNRYNTDGTPFEKDDESTAVYALAARFLYMSDEPEAADWCYSRMMDFQVEEGKHFAGGFGDEDTGMVYAFDQLEALFTMRTVDFRNEK